MARPPRDTHGPIVETGPTRGRNRSRNKDGRWRSKRSDAGTTRERGVKAKTDLGRWFWGSIILMAALSIILSVMSTLQRATEPPTTEPHAKPRSERSTLELSAAELEKRLSTVNSAAAEAVRFQIQPLLDVAYQPVYDAVPRYADYHYSVWGEYAELGTAAIGSVGAQLEQMLFDGLESRMGLVTAELDDVFSETFKAATDTEIINVQVDGAVLGPLTESALADAQRRMLLTVPVGTAAITGSKAVAAVIAKKIATKLAAKAALKAGGKWVVAGSAAGGGAALCAWSGPGAALCAAAGGIGAWLLADYGIVKLDEYWNREEFEADLRAMITEQKLANQIELEDAVTTRALAVQEMVEAVVEQHGFTLRELSGVGNLETCRSAMNLVEGYNLMRENIWQRTPQALAELRAKAAEEEENISFRSLMREIQKNLDYAERLKVISLRIKGNLPADHRANRDISGRLIINGNAIKIPQTRLDESKDFMIGVIPDASLIVGESLEYSIVLEQHLRIRKHRYFGGEGLVRVMEFSKEASGLYGWVHLGVNIAYDESAVSIDDVSTTSVTGEPLYISLRLRGSTLPELQKTPNCN